MTEPRQAFLFDLDGTLVDSVYQHVLAWHEVLARLLPPPPYLREAGVSSRAAMVARLLEDDRGRGQPLSRLDRSMART